MSIDVRLPVAAAVGLGTGDDTVAVVAASEAVTRRVGLRIVHVVAPGGRGGPSSESTGIGRRVEGLLAGVRAAHPELAVEVEFATGDLVTELLARTRDCALLVVGHDPRVRRRRGNTSVALGITDRADIPVLVCPTGGTPVPGPAGAGVLVGVDGAADDAVLAFAFAEAAARQVPLVAEHVWSTVADAVPARVSTSAEPVAGRAAGAASTHMLRNAIRPWADRYNGTPVRHVARHGLDAVIALTAAARSAELVVIGAHHGRPGGGEVRRAMLHRPVCPLAVVPITTDGTEISGGDRGCRPANLTGPTAGGKG